MNKLGQLIHAIRGVDYILIGGMAAIVHGSARFTQDIDLVYARSSENIERLVTALSPHQPYLRGAPPEERTELLRQIKDLSGRLERQ